MSAEMIQFFFGGQLIKGAAKGVGKGVQFVKKAGKLEKGVEGMKVLEAGVEEMSLGSKVVNKIFKFNIDIPDSFKGACPKELKKFFEQKGWIIKPAEKGKPGFRAENPMRKEDVFIIVEVDKSKLKQGTKIIEVKQGPYMRRKYLKDKGWPERIPLKDNPTLN